MVRHQRRHPYAEIYVIAVAQLARDSFDDTLTFFNFLWFDGQWRAGIRYSSHSGRFRNASGCFQSSGAFILARNYSSPWRPDFVIPAFRLSQYPAFDFPAGAYISRALWNLRYGALSAFALESLSRPCAGAAVHGPNGIGNDLLPFALSL